MHEITICRNLIRHAEKELLRLDPAPARLIAVRVAVGRLRQIEPEHMHFAYETLVRGTRLEGSKLEMRTLPLTGTCRDCEWRGEIRELFFCCAACGSNRGEFEGGMELLLESLEIEEETPRAP